MKPGPREAGTVEDRRYYAVRSRVISLMCIAPLFVLCLAVVVGASSSSDATAALIMAVPLALFLTLIVRTLYALVVITNPGQLTYRAQLRTYHVPKSVIRAASLDQGKSSVGRSNLMVVNLHLRDGSSMPLKVFNCFRPTPEASSPLGFERIKRMTSDLNGWLSNDEAGPPPPHGPDSA